MSALANPANPANPYPLRHPYSSLRPHVIRQYAELYPSFVETGTNVGHGIQAALDAGFSQIYSSEAVREWCDVARERFINDTRVAIYHLDSPRFLHLILPSIPTPAAIYLDAHSVAANPLLDELAEIARSDRKSDLIMIDDVRMFDTPDWHYLTRASAIDLIMTINPRYRITYLDTNHAHGDLLVAEIP